MATAAAGSGVSTADVEVSLATPSQNALAKLAARIAALEERRSRVTSNCDESPSPNQVRVTKYLQEAGVRFAYFHRVEPGYYDRTLVQRSEELRTTVHHLCKTLLVENKNCDTQSCEDPLNSRFYAIVFNYTSKFSEDALIASLRKLTGKSKSSFNFQMAPAEVAFARSGCEFNAVVPYGMPMPVPVIVSDVVMEGQPPYLWLGGGDVDLKLRLPLSEVKRLGALVLSCTTPKTQHGDKWV